MDLSGGEFTDPNVTIDEDEMDSGNSPEVGDTIVFPIVYNGKKYDVYILYTESSLEITDVKPKDAPGGEIGEIETFQVGPNAYASLQNGMLTITGTGIVNRYVSEERIKERISGLTNEETLLILLYTLSADENSIETVTPENVKELNGFGADFSNISNERAQEIADAINSYRRVGYIKSVIVEEGITEISDGGVFSTLPYLKNVELADTIITIGNDAFSICNNLKTVKMPSNLQTIGDNAFDSCNSLRGIIIPNGVISIGERAFVGCNDLGSITIPYSVTNIGYDAFYLCGGLTITIDRTEEEVAQLIEDGTFISGWNGNSYVNYRIDN